MKQILQIAAEQFFAIGIAPAAHGYGIVKNNFKNVPKSMPNAWDLPEPGADAIRRSSSLMSLGL